jgi:hypothetical protein
MENSVLLFWYLDLGVERYDRLENIYRCKYELIILHFNEEKGIYLCGKSNKAGWKVLSG